MKNYLIYLLFCVFVQVNGQIDFETGQYSDDDNKDIDVQIDAVIKAPGQKVNLEFNFNLDTGDGSAGNGSLVEPEPGPENEICQCGKVPLSRNTKIVNGQETPPHKYGFQVFIQPVFERFISRCGGTLISDKWVLSAAHCFLITDSGEHAPREVILSFGVHNVSHSEPDSVRQTVGASNIIKHEGYDDFNYFNDIALIRLNSPVTFTDKIYPACLPSLSDPSPLTTVTTMGWGTFYSGGDLSDVLMEVDLDILSISECQELYRDLFLITDNMMCTLSFNKDSCQGDSGGPSVAPKADGALAVVGITSFGNGCALPDNPGVSTNVLKYLAWIKEKTSETFCEDNI